MNTKVKAVLVKGRELLANGFTQNAYARTSEGLSVEIDHPHAMCFCSVGAIRRAVYLNDLDYDLSYDAERCLGLLTDQKEDMGVITYNDTHTKEEVLALWDEAIASDC